MITYSIVFPKGGTGKTTTAAELIYRLHEQGKRVLAVDLDSQGSLSTWLGFTDDSVVNGSTADVLIGHRGVAGAVTDCPAIPGVAVLVGMQDLEQVNRTSVVDLVTALRDVLAQQASGVYDAVVLDVPPSLSVLSLSAIVAADVVISPVSCDPLATDQIRRLREVIAWQVAKRLRPGAKVDVFVPTRYDARRRIDREVLEDLQETYGAEITISEPIPEAVAVKDSYGAGMPVAVFAPESKPALAYAGVMTTIIEEYQR